MQTDTRSRTRGRCNQCGGERWHDILYSLKEQTPGSESSVSLYELLRCAGCEEVKLRRTTIDGEDRHLSSKVEPDVTYYPPSTVRPQPLWISDLLLEQLVGDVTNEYDLLQEVYVALENGTPALAAMGLRAVIEAVMIKKVGDHGTFKENLSALQRKGLVSELDVQHLRDVLEVGHAVIHRGHLPSVQDVLSALDITETLVKRMYLDKNAVDALRKSVPSRGRPD